VTLKRNCALPGFVFSIILATLVACGISVLEASWLIDAERFHVSAHGRTSCRECHGDIPQNRLHPDPANVNESLKDFFRLEQCEDCHLEALEEIDEGTHGGLTDRSGEEMEHCIGCHDPHYQLPSTAKVDLALPAEQKCSACHAYRDLLPGFSEQDEACVGCHRRPADQDPDAAATIRGFCFHCHGRDGEEKPAASPAGMARIDAKVYPSTPHEGVSCLVCHPGAATYGHADQPHGDCLACHVRHDAKAAHDVHLSVSCQACHLEQVAPVKRTGSGKVLWQIDREPGSKSRVHHMVWARGEEACRRCHAKGNAVGAAAMVLPAKSVICMPCHPATLSVGDTTTLVALLLFLVGFVSVGSVWAAGSLRAGIDRSEEKKALQIARGLPGTVFSTRWFSVTKALILDGLLQRRLFKQSKSRWTIHSLIFLPFVFRSGWGLVGLVASLYDPEWKGTWILLDKNHPATAFLFDLTGALVILGIVSAVARRAGLRSEQVLPGLPGPDWKANGLLASIVLIGYLLEGMRIAMTGSPAGAEFAFVGYGVSRLFTGAELTQPYGYVWYTHAILTGAFVAYLPFSRMRHMIVAPISLALNAGSRHGYERLREGGGS
jgi:nitrate reductase gamma subunit